MKGEAITVRGQVQGVGFRPTVWRIATELGLAGNVRNTAEGVEIRAVGEPAADLSEKRMKAERLYIGDTEYDLYPGRD